MFRLLVLSTTVAVVSLGLAPFAAADEDSYLDAVQAAGVLEYEGDFCNTIDGICHGQWQTADEALFTGRWVCDALAEGKSPSMIADWLATGEGLMPSEYNGRVITAAAMAHLC